MQHNVINPEVRQSTYSLLVRSEEKERNIFEAAIYALFVLCVAVAVWQFAHQPVTVPEKIGVADTSLNTVQTASYAGG
ncbi:MAG: hypothetical protein ACJ8KU_09640 [Chthoniobacterales bacterium]